MMADWIPVSEHLPEPSEYILFTDGETVFYGYTFKTMWLTHSGGKQNFNITHWMKLPKPPQGGHNEPE
jgi:hypothetical protein